MLVSLHIENIAVIKKIDIDLHEGFTVLTGETGAGKSIIIDSINILLGARPSRDIIRSGEDIAVVSALFSEITQTNIISLSELGIKPDEEDSIFIQRTITTDGKSNTKINGRTVSVSLQREVCALLINIHGQHENQTLLNASKHLFYLDKYAGNEHLIASYMDCYEEMIKIKHDLSKLYHDEKDKKARIEMLRYQINDIDAARLRPKEDDELEIQKKRIQNTEKIQKQAKTIYGSLYSGDKGLSAFQQIERALNAIRQISDMIEDSTEFIEKLETYRYEIEDIAQRAVELIDDETDDPSAALDRMEARLDVINKLKHKYGSTVTEILEFRAKAVSSLEDIEMSDENIKKLNNHLITVKNEALQYAEQLSVSRQSAAYGLAEKITDELAFLDMSKVCFSVEVRKVDLNRLGYDDVEFMISTNPGEPMKSLGKIASGGELSRVMLAVKSVLADRENTETLIFDEIDTGISGKTSYKIGIKLKQTSKVSQVICVTHSAQIAALAHNHFYISKNEYEGRTETAVTLLDEKGRINEIARIMGGEEITDNLIDTAAEMLTAGETIIKFEYQHKKDN